MYEKFNFKKLAVALAICAPISASFAIDAPLNFNVTADVQDDTFLVAPENDWDKDAQRLSWNPATGVLASVTRNLHVQSSIGPVSAHLSAAPLMRDGVNSIPLVIKMGGKALGLAAAPIVVADAAAAPVGKRVPVEISAAPTGELKPGNYIGNVRIVLEATAP